MTAHIVTLRGLIKQAIQTVKDSSEFVYNAFSIEETYLPQDKITSSGMGTGKLYLLSKAYDDAIANRSLLIEREIGVLVSYQQRVSDYELTTINPLVELEQQIRKVVREVAQSEPELTYLRTEVLKDENELPYPYAALRENSLFQFYFTTYFKLFTKD